MSPFSVINDTPPLELSYEIGSSKWYQIIWLGGSWEKFIVQVRLIVEPRSKCKSGPPKMSAVGTFFNNLKWVLLLNFLNFLTNYVEGYKETSNWQCWHLAFINSAVTFCHPFYRECPFIIFFNCSKSLVASICVGANG